MPDADSDCSEGDGGQEVSSELVVARREPARMLQFVEEALDQVRSR